MPSSNSSTIVQPYLFFAGRCAEAVEFYRTALGAEVEMTMRYSDSPEPMPEGILAPGFEDKVMHTSFRIGDTTIMASDGCGGDSDTKRFDGFSLSLAVPDEATAQRAFTALADGGGVRMALGKTFWSPCFGMLADRFGVGWMINVVDPARSK